MLIWTDNIFKIIKWRNIAINYIYLNIQMFKTQKSLLKYLFESVSSRSESLQISLYHRKSIRAKAKVFASARMHSMTIGSSDSTRFSLRSSTKTETIFPRLIRRIRDTSVMRHRTALTCACMFRTPSLNNQSPFI